MIIVHLFLLFFFCFLLIKATEILLINLKSLATRIKIGTFAITGLVVALVTSLPEFFIGVTAALRHEPNLSLGNVIGANIANLSLVIGGAAIIGGRIAVRGSFLREDIFYAFLAGAAPMLLLFDKTLSRADGLILVCLYGFYQIMIFKEQRMETVGGQADFVTRLIHRLTYRETKKEIGWIFFGIALLLFSANALVTLAMKIAIGLNLPLLLIGLVLVAIGTTLPELVFETEAIINRQPEMVFGNLLGSIVANGTLIIGVVAIISPIKIIAFEEYLLATMAFVTVFSLFYVFVRSKRRLDRWEGVVLLGIYFLFVLLELLKP